MTVLEHQQIKGITIKNIVVTLISTASIVASVMTTYFGLKADIQAVKATQETETKLNDIRIKVLENEVNFLQKQLFDAPVRTRVNQQTNNVPTSKGIATSMLHLSSAK